MKTDVSFVGGGEIFRHRCKHVQIQILLSLKLEFHRQTLNSSCVFVPPWDPGFGVRRCADASLDFDNRSVRVTTTIKVASVRFS